MTRARAPLRRRATNRLRLRPRVYREAEIALGPGKAALLSAIVDTGSIRLAAERLGMSYMRAWTLVRTMNRCFAKPLVRAVRGGRKGGRAQLTPEGVVVLTLYRQLVAASHRAAQPFWQRIERRMER
jgi:molybdate transport system regulatory protein